MDAQQRGRCRAYFGQRRHLPCAMPVVRNKEGGGAVKCQHSIKNHEQLSNASFTKWQYCNVTTGLLQQHIITFVCERTRCICSRASRSCGFCTTSRKFSATSPIAPLAMAPLYLQEPQSIKTATTKYKIHLSDRRMGRRVRMYQQVGSNRVRHIHTQLDANGTQHVLPQKSQ